MPRSILLIALAFFFFACSSSRQIAKSAKENIFQNAALQTAHVGISINEPATGKYWYNFQEDKYFVPASNTKIPTCYAAMKYLGDSLVGLRYGISEPIFVNSDSMVLAIQPTGDPTFLHPDFKSQPVFDFLKLKAGKYQNTTAILDTIWEDERWGSGWSWNDYEAAYMAERNSFPIYGNVIDIKVNDLRNRKFIDSLRPSESSGIELFKTQHSLFDSLISRGIFRTIPPEDLVAEKPKIRINRTLSKNEFSAELIKSGFQNMSIPFVTDVSNTTLWLLSDLLKFRFGVLRRNGFDTYQYVCPDCNRSVQIKQWNNVHSQPTDSLLKPMMHRSDNFFAEQSLLMVSNEMLGIMNDAKIIDTLLKTDFKDLPQRPRWADGSGLSRYNLFTPQDFVFILNKMGAEFGIERIKNIFPTGNEGTLRNYYRRDSGYIFAKTGTLSGVVAISGFLYTKKNKLLIFSVLVNNHQGSSTDIRRAVEKFIERIRNEY